MLASITPLGERSRGFSWHVTVTAFAVGALGAGALAGAALGTIGSLLPGGSAWRGLALAAVLAITVAFDATSLRRRLPAATGWQVLPSCNGRVEPMHSPRPQLKRASRLRKRSVIAPCDTQTNTS